MAHTPSAKKRIRQTQKRQARNSYVKTTLRTFNKKFNKALDAGELDQARELFTLCQKKFAKAASKGIIPRNTASRKTSRLAAALRKAEQASA